MNSIDQKVVEMKFDNSQFESAVSQTMSTLEKFKSKLNFKDTGKGIDKLGKATSNYQYTLQDVGQSLANLEKRFGIVGTVGARIFEKLTDSAYGFVTKGIHNIVGSITQGGMSRAMNLEQAKFQMEGILKDSKRVHQIIYDEILPELQGTPFSLDQAAVVIGQLTASGKKSTEEIRTATKAISGVAAMTNSDFASIGNIFTKVAGNGRVMGDTLQQLSSRGLNAAADLKNFFNGVNDGSIKASKATTQAVKEITNGVKISEQELRDFVSDKDITISYDMFAEAMSSMYGAQAQKSTQMYTGALEDLKAALARIGAEPAALKLNFLRDAFNALVPAVDAVNAVIKPFWNASRSSDKAFKNVEEYVKPFTGPIAKKVQEAGWAFQSLFVRLDKNHEIMRYSKKNLKDLGVEVVKYTHQTADGIQITKKQAKALEELGVKVKKLKKPVTEWRTAWGQVVEGKEAVMNPKMWKTITAVTNSFINVFASLGSIAKTVGKGIRQALPTITFDKIVAITAKIEEFTKKLKLSDDNLVRLKWTVRGLFTPLGLAIRGITSIVGILIKTFQVLWDVLGPIMNVVSAFFGMIGRIISGIGSMLLNFGNILKGNISNTTKEFQKSEQWANVVERVVDVCNKLAAKFDDIGIKVKNFFATLHTMPAVQTSLTVLGTILEGLKKTFGFIVQTVQNLFDALSKNEAFKSFFDKIKEFLSPKADNLEGWFSKFESYAAIVDVLTGSFDGLLDVIAGFPNFKPLKGVRKWFGDLGKLVLDVGKSFLDGDFFVDRAKDAFSWFANYRKLGGRLKNGFVPAIKALGTSLPQLLNFKNYGEMLDAVGKKISSAVSFIFKTLGLFGTGVAQDATKGVQNLSKITNAMRNSAVSLGDSQFFKPVIDLFNKLSESFGEWAKNMDVQSAKRLVIALAYFGTCLYYLNTINSAAKAFRGLTKIAETVASGIGAIGKMANAISMIPAAIKGAISAFKLVGYMTALSVALVGIAASMFIISQIDSNKLAAAAAVTLGIVIVVGGLIVAVNKLSSKLGESTTKTMLSLAAIIGSIAGAVLAIAASLKLISDIDDNGLAKAVLSVSSIIAVFGIVMGGLALLPKLSKDGGAFNNVSTSAWALVGIAAGIRTLVEAIRDLADLYQNGDEEAIKKAVELVNLLIVLTGVFGLLAGWGKHSFASGMAIIPLALGLKIVISAIVDLANTLTDADSLGRAMTALDGLSTFVMKLGVLFVAIGVMNALSGLISKGDFVSSGRKGMGGALIAIAEIIAGVWVVSQAMMKLGTLTDDQIENGMRVLKAFGILVAMISAISYFGGGKVAAGAGAFAGLAAGLFLLAEGIVALGETEHFAAGFGRMGVALLGLIGSVVLATKLITTFMTVKQAASIALLSAAMLGFALSIRMMAECPWESLMFAVIGLVGTMAIAAGVMSLFSAAGVAMLPITGAFALLGIAALGLGAGIFLLTLALSALIPLIIGLGDMPMDKLQAGLTVLNEAAKGLAEVFGTLAGGILKLAGGLVTLGVALMIVGVGGVVLAAGIVACAAAVFLFAGSLIVLYEVLSNFFPSVVKPVENGMIQLIDTFTRGLLDPTVNTVSKTGDEVNNTLAEKGDEGAAIADEKAHAIADKYDIWSLMKQNGFEGDMAELAAMTGQTPEEMGAAWGANSGEFTGAVDGTVVDANAILDQFGTNSYDKSYGAVSNLAGGITDASSLPTDATSGMLGTIMGLYEKHEEAVKRRGEAQTQKLYGGMKSKEDLVEGEAKRLANKAVPPDKSEAAKAVGRSIAAGLKAGISAGADAVYRIAEQVAATAAAKMKKGADVNSPSKKTIPVGSALGEGLIVGMQNIAGKVYMASEDLAVNSVDSLTSAMQQTASAFDADLDFNPTITPVVDLTNVDQSVNQMGSMFNTAFGVTTPFGGTNAALAARSFYDSRNQNDRNSELSKLANSINGMTDTMNSRSLNIYNTIDGSADPEAFADGLIRSFRLNARTV